MNCDDNPVHGTQRQPAQVGGPVHANGSAHCPGNALPSAAHARIAAVREYLSGFSEADFVDAASRRVTLPRWEGKCLSGQEFMTRSMLPNFYFHVTTAAILRHNGVDLGKRGYLGAVQFDPA